jgi:hypothetical protein
MLLLLGVVAMTSPRVGVRRLPGLVLSGHRRGHLPSMLTRTAAAAVAAIVAGQRAARCIGCCRKNI